MNSKTRHKITLIFVDLTCFLVSSLLMLGYYPSEVTKLSTTERITHALLILFLVSVCRFLFHIYSNVWRYAQASEYFQLVISDLAAGIAYLLLSNVLSTRITFVRSVALISVATLATLSARFLYQILRGYLRQKETAEQTGIEKLNIAIVGAGAVGSLLITELINDRKKKYHPVCFIDSDPLKIGSLIKGIRVIPISADLNEMITKYQIQQFIIALPDLPPEQKKEIYKKYSVTDCPVKMYDYPLLEDGLSEHKLTLRDVHIEDLLFRNTHTVNSPEAKEFYRNKKILVTGGGGSIGSELCRQIAKLQPKQLVIIDIYENNAYDIQQELIRTYGSKLNLAVEIASVRDEIKMDELFAIYRPEIVFHAAAHKHVPLMEQSCSEAVKNNVFGTYVLANLAEKYAVQKFILISTDKAVNPTNIMGASKRMCEKIIQSRKDSKTDFVAVRFGNVLGSNGSVIPLFKKQIESGGPVTITDNRIIRYFMTIPEASQLVLQTGAMAAKSEIYVLDMGNPVRILDLAENLIRLSGLKPYEDIKIVEIGLRPGEKLYEELLMRKKDLNKTENELIFIERDEPITRAILEEKLEILAKALEEGGNATIRSAMMQVVSTYHNADEVNLSAAEAPEMSERG